MVKRVISVAMNKLGKSSVAISALGFFLGVVVLFFSKAEADGAPARLGTGFLVVAEDRGFLGNQEIAAIMAEFKRDYTASLALIGKNRQGVEGDYDAYIKRAIAELEAQDVSQVVAIPLFLSEGHFMLGKYRSKIDALVAQAMASTPLWTPAMAESYLAGQILLDRVEALSEDPQNERLIILATGAVDAATEQRIKAEIESLLPEVTGRYAFREVSVQVYYDRESQDDYEDKNGRVDELIIQLAAKRGRTLLVPFAIGVKFDQRMSMSGWLKRKFSGFDVEIGEPLLPHPEVLTWLRKMANHHSHALPDQVAVIIMPHGSTQPYNDGLEAVIAPLRSRYRIEVAPGMGDPLILGQAVRKLEQEGFTRIVFVRMYALRDHMKARTDYILGLTDEVPSGHGSRPPSRVRSAARFVTVGGYEEDPLIAAILRERILEISQDPANETVILLAHGRGDDKADQRWLAVIEDNIRRIQQSLPYAFRRMQAMTLREDWPDKRAQALRDIRRVIEQGARGAGRVLVISNRLYGSGPYRRLLQGLDFTLNGKGLVPHPNMTRWLEQEIERAARMAVLPATG